MLASAAACTVALLTACTGPGANGGSPGTAATPTVIATTTVLGDIAGRIARCGGGTAQTLMPAGADPHDFAPSSAQLAAVVDAPLVVVNGLGLEAGLGDALAAATADGAHVLEVGPLVNPVPFDEHAGAAGSAAGHADEHADETPGGTAGHDEHGHGSLDPHVWFDMARMAVAAERIGDALAENTGDSAFAACGQQEAAIIREGESRVRAILATVPPANRVLVTDHDALGYFADAYGFRIAGAVTASGTTLAEPSSADLARLGEVLRAEGVRAIFANVSEPSALAEAVAAEAGTGVVVVPLHVESIGAPGTPADSYVGMMEENATAIAEALGGSAGGAS